jgi:hypothetical protein
MVHTIAIWLLAAGFFGAGVFNVIGTATLKADFARWGYPSWWNRLTGGVEIICAALMAYPASRIIGLALGAVIIAAAIITVLRHRDFSHLAPLSLFVVFLVLAEIPV